MVSQGKKLVSSSDSLLGEARETTWPCRVQRGLEIKGYNRVRAHDLIRVCNTRIKAPSKHSIAPWEPSTTVKESRAESFLWPHGHKI